MIPEQVTKLIAHANAYTSYVDLRTAKVSTKDELEALRACTDTLHDLLRVARFPGSPNLVSVYEQWMQARDPEAR
jgi:hypothetical protein